MTELPFVRVLYWAAALHQVSCFHNHLAKKNPAYLGYVLCFFMVLWFDMSGYDVIAYVTWVGKWHHSTFSINSFLVLSFDTRMSQLRRRLKILRENQCYGNLPFVSINVSFRETVPLKKVPWIFPHPNFIKNNSIFHYQTVHMLGFYIAYFKYIPYFKLYCNICIHNITIKCC